MTRLAATALFAATLATAGPSGVVVNVSEGAPEPRVPVTLISFAQGMDPVEEVYTDENGEFRFEKDPPGMAMLRVEHEAISYTVMLRPDAPREGIRAEVFDVRSEPPVPPTGRILVLEPGASEMVVNESYLFENATNPPVTYRDPERGTLRFHLPPEAKGIVQVEASGPQRMPLPSSAEKTDEENVYKVDFPIKPGENRVSLTYLVPRRDDEPFVSPALYPNLATRVAAPAGVEVRGEGISDLGAEPTTQARVYEAAAGKPLSIFVVGEGQLRRREAPPPTTAAGGSNEISIQPAPIAEELPWIIGITAAILAIGFFNLYGAGARRGRSARRRDGVEAG